MPQANGVWGVRALTANVQAAVVLAGGEFITLSGVSQKRFAIFD